MGIYGNVAPGHYLGEAAAETREAIATTGLPAGYGMRFSGQVKILEETAGNMILAIGLASIFMYMVPAAQFESLLHPFLILLSLPLSVPFALLSLIGTGRSLNLFSALGVLLLSGIVKKNGILQIGYMNRLRGQGYPLRDAILEANRVRLPPILMTTFSIVAGLIPTATGIGAGASQRSAIAVTIIGGQTLCLLLTLLVVPIGYSLVEDCKLWLARRRPASSLRGGARRLGARRAVRLRLALAAEVLGEDNRLGEVAHGTPQAAALVAEAEVGLFLGETVPVLEDALGPLDQLTGFELALHLRRLLDEPGVLLRQARPGDGDTHLLADESQKSDLLGAVRVRLPVMHIDDADNLAAADKRHRKKRLVGVFDQAREGPEAGIGRRVGGKRHDGLVLGHPSRDAFASHKAERPQFPRVRQLRGPQDDFAAGGVGQIDQAGVASGHLGSDPDHLPQHLVQTSLGRDDAADAVKQADLRRGRIHETIGRHSSSVRSAGAGVQFKVSIVLIFPGGCRRGRDAGHPSAGEARIRPDALHGRIRSEGSSSTFSKGRWGCAMRRMRRPAARSPIS